MPWDPKYRKPAWYDGLSPEAKARFDATDWDAEEADPFLGEDETMAVGRPQATGPASPCR